MADCFDGDGRHDALHIMQGLPCTTVCVYYEQYIYFQQHFRLLDSDETTTTHPRQIFDLWSVLAVLRPPLNHFSLFMQGYFAYLLTTMGLVHVATGLSALDTQMECIARMCC